MGKFGGGEEEKGFLFELSLIYSIVGKRYKIKAKLSNGDYYFYILINKPFVLLKSTERKFVGLTQFYIKKITENIKIWPHSLEYDSLQWYHCLFEHTVGARLCNIQMPITFEYQTLKKICIQWRMNDFINMQTKTWYPIETLLKLAKY